MAQANPALDLLNQLSILNAKQEVGNVHKIEKFVVTAIVLFALVYVLGVIKNQYAKLWLKLVSFACYLSFPALISYTLGLMGSAGSSQLGGAYVTDLPFKLMYGTWAVFLLFPYASFDNLSAFNLDEINGRSKFLFQFLSQSVLLVLLAYTLPKDIGILPIAFVFLVVCLKVMERIVALAHAAGETSGVRENLKKIFNYINKEENDQVEAEADPLSMQGYKYLVGPRYSKTKDGKMVDGVTLEKIWGCNGRLLSSEFGGGDRDGRLKDTCLSFALLWLLLGKIRGYPNLYAAGSTSRMKAWKLVRDGLLSEQDRAFRVIEVELSFLRDYFYSKYMFFYLNGTYWKLISLIAFPIMFWYFTQYALDFELYNTLYEDTYEVKPNLNRKAFAIMILVLFALEVIQLCTLITSRWCHVIFICYYVAKREASQKKDGFLSRCFEWVIEAVCRVALCTSAISWKPWKRELGQYSILESCTCFNIDNKALVSVSDVFGIPLPKPSKKEGESVALSQDLKTAVVLSLQTNGPKLSNGVSSLRRNGVEEKISWACELMNDSETILVWHIATSICEMNPTSNNDTTQGFEVATKLSKYCAYLLAFAPLLVSIPVLEAEVMCESVISEARELLKKPFSVCGKVGEVNRFDKLMELLTSDKEVGGESITTLQKGVQLGEYLNSIHGNERRWKLLAEFWAEMILYLAPSNSNEMAHVEKLAEGGEFITHLWALLIHAGIVDRDN